MQNTLAKKPVQKALTVDVAGSGGVIDPKSSATFGEYVVVGSFIFQMI